MCAARQGVGIHGGFDGAHHQVAVHGDAQPQVVDGFAGAAHAVRVAQRRQVLRLAVVQLALDVPEPVLALVTLVGDASDMAGSAGGRG